MEQSGANNESRIVKNSDIKCDFEIESIQLDSVLQMQNFKKLIEENEEKWSKVGAVKLIPPKKFNAGSKRIKEDKILENVVSIKGIPIKNQEKDLGYELSFENATCNTYNAFINEAAKNVPPNELTEEEIEDEAWKSLSGGEITGLYGIDNNTTLFSDNCNYMNLNKFTIAESNIHGQNIKRIDGIQKPYVYHGTYLTYFGLHLEDMDLNSINYLHRGHPKIWYFIPLSEHEKLEKLCEKLGQLANIWCNKYASHKSLMISPIVLREHKIKFGRVKQNAGEYVVSLSGGYHMGFNTGFNHCG